MKKTERMESNHLLQRTVVLPLNDTQEQWGGDCSPPTLKKEITREHQTMFQEIFAGVGFEPTFPAL